MDKRVKRYITSPCCSSTTTLSITPFSIKAHNVYAYGAMVQQALRNVNNCLNTNIYSYLETFGCQSCNLDSNIVHFFNTSIN